ncbi:hypothetical protein WJX74_005793 [Apatococcus lobatus]|uniref:Uncharacterized protein n=1 Tax=Apatococcus lobatus TaxID=904363 RepID=A0AAW1R4P7_9CHLO
MMELHHLAGRPSRTISFKLRHCVPLLDRRAHQRTSRNLPVTAAAAPARALDNRDPASATFSGRNSRQLGRSSGSKRGERVVTAAGTQSQPLYTTLWTSYARSVETNPVPTKAATSFMGFVIGDLLAQRIAGEPFSALRMLRLGTYGLLIDGPIGHAWYKFLDRVVYPDKPQSTAAVLIKTAADQLVWAPIMTVVFFALLKTLEGHPELIAATVQDKLVKTVVANYILWPAAHFINFRFVPNQHRILYNNCVSVIWSAFLSWSTCAAHNPCFETPKTFQQAFEYCSCWAQKIPNAFLK